MSRLRYKGRDAVQLGRVCGRAGQGSVAVQVHKAGRLYEMYR